MFLKIHYLDRNSGFGTYITAMNADGGQIGIERGFLSFDTRSVASNSFIYQAQLKLTPVNIYNSFSGFTDFISVYKSNSTSFTAVIPSDYSKFSPTTPFNVIKK